MVLVPKRIFPNQLVVIDQRRLGFPPTGVLGFVALFLLLFQICAHRLTDCLPVRNFASIVFKTWKRDQQTKPKRRYYLNQGAQGWCESGRSTSDLTITESDYCQWEDWFTADVSGCLELLDPERLRVLFVKRAAADAVLVHFRIGIFLSLIHI